MKNKNTDLNPEIFSALSTVDQYSLQQLKPSFSPVAKPQPKNMFISPKAIEKRWQAINCPAAREHLLDQNTFASMSQYQKNIENFIGTVKVPVGIAGPLRINGLFAQDDYFLPLATTEAALVASYNRGALLITEAGGCSTMLLNEGVCRTPGFAFETLIQAGKFVAWATTQQESFRQITEASSNHLKLKDLRINIEGNNVYLIFDYLTGDASGQNMVTIATNCALEYIIENTPVAPKHYFLDANLSGDKKATSQSLSGVRGKKVTSEITISAELIKKRLHTTPELMANFWRMSTVGGVLSGSVGVQGHYANGLAALYIACGQDAACVAESAIGVTRMELNDDGSLYAAVTLPNLMVGTVGGGTGLASQQANLQLLGLAGAGNARALAEVCAGLCLAGELSIIGAFCAGHFAKAHHKLAR
ncbi:hydroxymethylglutaryl-CoA reductase [Thalassotalea sp. ND16A]|uniref:hydroxymethylglutaryl-CoA reductase n=1 Tax=Thalassotalea sp. ND16A TaxID=1535422 RepID=UPI00051A1088|nr:hydroxymethylglutaryl-CoA reductase [Thalassotalea sp. ND16A]KGJ99019.1 Hydroxymethylglutaryl-CoA reductase (NADPH) [Thalassotalea sp. ND16A]